MILCSAVQSWPFSVFLSYHQANSFRVCHRPTNCFLCLIWQIGNIVRRAGLSKLVHGGQQKKEVNQKKFCLHTAVDAECIWLCDQGGNKKGEKCIGREGYMKGCITLLDTSCQEISRQGGVNFIIRPRHLRISQVT